MNKGDATLTHERLKQVLDYDAETGRLRYLERKNGRRLDGKVGQATPQGYVRVMIDGQRYMAHRVVWFWVTGQWPKEELDHVNRDRADNRWANLREATRSENRCNTRKSAGKSTGFKGVSFKKGGFEAAIRKNKTTFYLGRFATAERAHAAYAAAASKLHGEFANP